MIEKFVFLLFDESLLILAIEYMNIKELEFCELLCAKFCHDLSGPVGAINNGIDFLESDNEIMREKATELVKLSSNQAVNRLAFFRQAYGSVGVEGEVNITQLRQFVGKFIQDSKIRVEYDGSMSDFVVSNLFAKTLLNLLIITSNLILLNGEINFSFLVSGEKRKVVINANAPAVKIDEELIKILSNTNSDSEVLMTTRNVQHYYTRFLIDALGAKLSIDNNKKQVVIEIEA